MDAVDLLGELTDHGFGDTGTPRKVEILNDTIWDICSREPWPFLEKSLDLTFDGINAKPTNWPTNVRAVISITDKSTGRALNFARLDELDKLYGPAVDQVGTVSSFYFEAGVMKFAMIPSSSTVMRVRYLQWPTAINDTTLEASIIIPPQHHRIIVLGALWKLYDMEDDPDIAQRFEDHYERRLVSMRESLWRQQYDQPETIDMTDPEYFFGYGSYYA